MYLLDGNGNRKKKLDILFLTAFGPSLKVKFPIRLGQKLQGIRTWGQTGCDVKTRTLAYICFKNVYDNILNQNWNYT